MKNRNCEICGEYSGKRKICKKCKEEQPYKAAAPKTDYGAGGNPFIRKQKKAKEQGK